MDEHQTNSPNSFNHQGNEAQESFRQNPFFAEKILDIQGMFSTISDDHDIRKVTREKVESMLYAEQLTLSIDSTETSDRPGPQGINQWIWEHRAQKELIPSVLCDFLKNGLKNCPHVFFKKFEVARDVAVHVSNFYKITYEQVQNNHLLNPDALRYAMEHEAKSSYRKILFNFLMQKSIDSGLLKEKLQISNNPLNPPRLHPRIQQYQMHLQERGLSREHIRHVTAFVHQLFSWLCANIRTFAGTTPDKIAIFQIDNDHLLAYRSYKLKQVQGGTCSPITFNNHVSAIRTFYIFLKDRFGYVPPLKRFHAINAPRYRPRDIPSDEQIETYFSVVKLYAADPVREEIGYRFMFHLGFRLSEVAQINWKDINLGTRTIVVHSKGKRSHVLPLAGQLYQCLKQLPAPQDHQTFLLGEKPTTIADNLYLNFKLYAMIAGWSFPGGVHFFRHIFITRLAQKGILPQALKELARVNKLDTVALYMHLAHQDQQMIHQINMLNYK